MGYSASFDICITFASDNIGEPMVQFCHGHRIPVNANPVVLDDFEPDIVQGISDLP